MVDLADGCSRRELGLDPDGVCVYACASSPTSPSSVAEKNIVWRSRGRRLTIRSTCGLKPMSSIRSASSRTRISTASIVTHAAVEQVLQATRRRHQDHVRVARRVGLRTDRDASVDGGDLQAARRREESDLLAHLERELARRNEDERCRTGVVERYPLHQWIANASVLPDPVGDFTSRSLPASAGGIASVWIWNGLVMPRASSAAVASRSRRARQMTVTSDSCDLVELARDLPALEPTRSRTKRISQVDRRPTMR